MRTYAAADWMWHVAYTFTLTLMQNIHHSLSLIAFPKSSLCFSPCMLFLHVSWSLNVYILPGGMNEAFYWPTRAFDFETENGCLPCACVPFVYLRVRALSKSTLCVRMHMPASRSLHMPHCSTKLHMTSICMQGNSDLITGILFLIKTCRRHQPLSFCVFLSLSSPPFFVFFPFSFPSRPWHK